MGNGTGLWVCLFLDLQSGGVVFDGLLSQVSLTNDSKRVGCGPDTSSVVGGCDCSISVVDDLVTILKVSDHLSLSGNDSHLFTLVNIHAILINDRLFLG